MNLSRPELDRLLPGLGAPLPITLDGGSAAVGRTLAAFSLRAVTGATVLATVRDGAGVLPTAGEPLRAGDVLALAGTQDALAAAPGVLEGRTLTDGSATGGSADSDGNAPSNSHE